MRGVIRAGSVGGMGERRGQMQNVPFMDTFPETSNASVENVMMEP